MFNFICKRLNILATDFIPSLASTRFSYTCMFNNFIPEMPANFRILPFRESAPLIGYVRVFYLLPYHPLRIFVDSM